MGRDAQPLLRINPHCSGLRPVTTLSHIQISAFLLASSLIWASTLQAQDKSAPRTSETSASPQICAGQNTQEQERFTLKHLGSSDEAIESGEAVARPDADSLSTTGAGREDAASDLAEVESPLRCLRLKHQETEARGSAGGKKPAEDPTHPSVTFSAGVLTVVPHNAPMGEVLQAVQSATGFVLDFHPSNDSARVFGQVGPLPLREALVQLLYGSGFNYIIQTAAKNPAEVTRLFVSPQIAGSGAQTAAVTTPAAAPEDSVEGQNLYGGFSDAGGEEPLPPPNPPANRGTPSNAANVPGVPTDFNLKQAAQDAKKSPGEILDELQKRQLEILDAQTPPPQ